MAKKFGRTEDEIRDAARKVLGLYDTESALSGTGQITSFNKLGFEGVKDRPDGWYLPNDTNYPAIICEFKPEDANICLYVEELLKNCKIALSKYSKVIGVLYNGTDLLVYKNLVPCDVVPDLQNKEYYLSLFDVNSIDKQKIYTITKRINDSLHFDFGIKDLYQRMIFTACALVAKRYGAFLQPGMSYNTFCNSIRDTLSKSYAADLAQNSKLNLLLDVYSEIKMNITTNQKAIDDFIKNVSSISDLVNSDFWNGEDVMAIFFNEFTRYKKKSEHGQVFTPDNITSLMYRLIGVNKDDRVLDAACGSGAFLVKSMCNMIKESGGIRTKKADHIKHEQIFGIEISRDVYALACANMLIHKDGKTNLEQLDSRSEDAAKWIKSKDITKVLMNPPFENKYGCMDIVENVLNSVPRGTLCAFILPDKKLEKKKGQSKRILKTHTLQKIIKLPEKTFSGVTTSVFIFTAHLPQNNKDIFTCNIENDGLETVKNQGRQDIKGAWKAIEDFWCDVISKQVGDASIKWIKSTDKLCYPVPMKEVSEVHKSDFVRTVMNRLLFEHSIDEKVFQETILEHVLYGVDIDDSYKRILDIGQTGNERIDISTWAKFRLDDLFVIDKGSRLTKSAMKPGRINYIGATAFNNGITNQISNDEEIHEANTITVCYNGSIGESFYQSEKYWATDDVNVLTAKFEMDKYIALFLCPLIKMEGQNFSFIDKWTKENMQKSTIKLPVNSQKEPDWQYMRDYIKDIYEKLQRTLQ